MASFFFDDYFFPSELYDRETGDFTAPVRTLIDFAPHILQELPKQEKDQKPINSKKQDSWTRSFLSSAGNGYLGSLLTSERTKAFTEFVIRCGSEYMKSTAEKRQEEERYKQYKAEDRKRRMRENRSRWFNKDEVSSSSEDEDEKMEERLRQEKEKKEKSKKENSTKQEVTRSATANNAMMTSAVAASVISLSLYSTYQASVAFSDISFHNQLELLTTQIQSIIQSTEVWVQEHEKMNDKIPSQVRTDLILVKQLVDNLVRLDPRSNKRAEAAGWGLSAVGGLSALGGFALGSAFVATGGAALAVGGVIAMVSAKAQSAGKSNVGARILLESQVREKVKECQKNAKERERVIENEFHQPIIIPEDQEENPTKTGDKRKLKETLSSTHTASKKEKTAILA